MRELPAALCVVLVVTLGSCKAEPLNVDSVAADATVIDARDPATDRIARLTRGVAVALGSDDGLRDRVRLALAASNIREGKLAFSQLLDDAALALGDGIASAEGRDLASVKSLLDSIMPLEFYLPVPEHRPWNGSRDVVIASALGEDGLAAAYDLQGRVVRLDETNYKDNPLLVLVPVETDFTNEQPQATSPASVISVPPGWPDGIYMTYSNLWDRHEPFYMGGPELELHIGRATAEGFRYVMCAGEEETTPYLNYNQDDQSWSGQVLVGQSADLANELTEIHIWENDNGTQTHCPVKPAHKRSRTDCSHLPPR